MISFSLSEEEQDLMLAIKNQLFDYRMKGKSTWTTPQMFNKKAKNLGFPSTLECYIRFAHVDGVHITKKKDILYLSQDLVLMGDKEFIHYLSKGISKRK